MIDFGFAPAGPAHLRITYSPLWECVISIRALRDPARHALFRPWICGATPVVASEDLHLLDALVRADGGYIPDFLAPPPTEPGLTFEAELARLRDTAPDVLEGEVARAAEPRGGAAALRLRTRYAGRPAALRDAIAGAVERYWNRAIAPEWPRMQAVLEGDVLWRARTLAQHGAAEVLRTLHPAVAHAPGAVRVASAQEGRVDVGSEELLLVPSVFAWPDVFTVHDRAWRASIYYPARGVGTVWDSPPGDRQGGRDPLALLAGPGRARVLRALSAPATTAELAARLNAAPASVSAHLQRLWRARLLDRVRIGRRVFYQTSAACRELLSLLEEETPR